MLPSEILRAGLAKLNSGKNWIQQISATCDQGFVVGPWSKKATHFCASGCVNSAAECMPAADKAKVFLYIALPKRSINITQYNDALERTWPEIETWFGRAIELALKEEERFNRV